MKKQGNDSAPDGAREPSAGDGSGARGPLVGGDGDAMSFSSVSVIANALKLRNLGLEEVLTG